MLFLLLCGTKREIEKWLILQNFKEQGITVGKQRNAYILALSRKVSQFSTFILCVLFLLGQLEDSSKSLFSYCTKIRRDK